MVTWYTNNLLAIKVAKEIAYHQSKISIIILTGLSKTAVKKIGFILYGKCIWLNNAENMIQLFVRRNLQ